jgi:SAM-dependent methyltransferase
MQKYLYADLYRLEDKHWWHIAKRNIVSHFLQKYLKSRKEKVLDVGCGTGKNLEHFSKYGNCFGIDNSKEAIEYCKKRGLKKVKLATTAKTGFKTNSFDAITLLDVLEHVDEKPTLREVKRLLRKKGVCIITVPALPILWSKWDEVLHHKRRYTHKSLIQTLESHGFKVIHISYMYTFLVLPVFVVRKIKELFFPDYYPSDFKLSSPLINKIMLNITLLESQISKQGKLPIGLSLIAVATI